MTAIALVLLVVAGVIFGVIGFAPSEFLGRSNADPTPFPTVAPRPILQVSDDVINQLKKELSPTPAARAGWEYLAMEKRPSEIVDTLGEQPRWLRKVGLDGWELISISDPAPHYGGGPTYVTLLFKRAK